MCCDGEEVWKAIEGTAGLYEVSTHGRVRSWNPLGMHATLPMAKRKPRRDPIVLKQWDKWAKGGNYYRRVHIRYEDGSHRLENVAHLVLWAFEGPCPDGMIACHNGDGDIYDNRRCNLRWDTPANNAREGKGAKLTVEKVRAIRRLCADGSRTRRELAAEFGVSYQSICSVVRHETWRNV